MADTPDIDRAATLALLNRKGLPVPVNPVAEIAGLRPIEAAPSPLVEAMRELGRQGEFPWNAGYTRDVRIGGRPAHDPGAMAFRPQRSDVITLNNEHELMRAFLENPRLAPLLASVLLHENEHVGGADERDARQTQAEFLRRQKGEVAPAASKFAEILSQ